MTFTPQEALFLINGGAQAWLEGPPIWTPVNSIYRGEVAVWANGFEPGDIKFILNITSRPNAPTFVLSIRNEFCRRLDVNQQHNEFDETHLQGCNSAGGDTWTQDAQTLFPGIPDTGTVGGAQYAATFLAFAASVGVGVGTFEWVDAPEGKPS